MKAWLIAAGAATVAAALVAATGQGADAPAAKVAAKPLVLDVWPEGKVPGEKGGGPAETTEVTKDASPVTKVSNISRPTLLMYRPEKAKDTGAAVLIAPGGAYKFLAIDLEGEEVAASLNSVGVTGVILKYRVPAKVERGLNVPPVQDAQRALGVIRAHAREWGLDEHRVGMMGFSAGAHLTAVVSTNYDKRMYEAVDEDDTLSCRPDFSILIYPAFIAPFDRLEPPIKVDKNTPPAFIVQTSDDEWQPKNSTIYWNALTAAKVPSELHLYPDGGHGYGLRPSKHTVSTWPVRCAEWMKNQGWLGTAK